MGPGIAFHNTQVLWMLGRHLPGRSGHAHAKLLGFLLLDTHELHQDLAVMSPSPSEFADWSVKSYWSETTQAWHMPVTETSHLYNQEIMYTGLADRYARG